MTRELKPDKASGGGFSSPHQTGWRGLESLQVTENGLLERKRLKTEERPEEVEHLGKEQELRTGPDRDVEDKAHSRCVPYSLAGHVLLSWWASEGQ